MLKPEQLSAIDARTCAATPGKWTHSRLDIDSYVDTGDGYIPVAYVYRDPEERVPFLGDNFRGDSIFVANARSDIPALLAHIREQEAIIVQYKPYYDRFHQDEYEMRTGELRERIAELETYVEAIGKRTEWLSKAHDEVTEILSRERAKYDERIAELEAENARIKSDA